MRCIYVYVNTIVIRVWLDAGDIQICETVGRNGQRVKETRLERRQWKQKKKKRRKNIEITTYVVMLFRASHAIESGRIQTDLVNFSRPVTEKQGYNQTELRTSRLSDWSTYPDRTRDVDITAFGQYNGFVKNNGRTRFVNDFEYRRTFSKRIHDLWTSGSVEKFKIFFFEKCCNSNDGKYFTNLPKLL